jgi:hypothetical protein
VSVKTGEAHSAERVVDVIETGLIDNDAIERASAKPAVSGDDCPLIKRSAKIGGSVRIRRDR